ncbi:flagellar basal body protein [Rickettsiales bacterium]|nr:flagellar basal body protein [Rickettsiales bacterium]
MTSISNGPMNIALSGLRAAEKRLQVSANNVANSRSTVTTDANGNQILKPYQPQEVVLSSQERGGVLSQVKDTDKEAVQTYEPGNPDADANGIISIPNVDLAEELVKQFGASVDYKANIKVIERQQVMLGALIDRLA